MFDQYNGVYVHNFFSCLKQSPFCAYLMCHVISNMPYHSSPNQDRLSMKLVFCQVLHLGCMRHASERCHDVMVKCEMLGEPNAFMCSTKSLGAFLDCRIFYPAIRSAQGPCVWGFSGEQWACRGGCRYCRWRMESPDPIISGQSIPLKRCFILSLDFADCGFNWLSVILKFSLPIIFSRRLFPQSIHIARK